MRVHFSVRGVESRIMNLQHAAAGMLVGSRSVSNAVPLNEQLESCTKPLCFGVYDDDYDDLNSLASHPRKL